MHAHVIYNTTERITGQGKGWVRKKRLGLRVNVILKNPCNFLGIRYN